MAYRMTLDKIYPEGAFYKGQATEAQAEFTGVSGLTTAIEKTVWLYFSLRSERVLRIRVEEDVKFTLALLPLGATKYRLTIWAHGTPVALVVWAGIGLVALGLIALTTWNIKTMDWGGKTVVGGGIILLILAALYFLGVRKEVRKYG